MSNKTHSVLDAAQSGRLGSVHIGQTETVLLKDNFWISETRLAPFQELFLEGKTVGWEYDFRPYFILKLFESADDKVINEIEFPLPTQSELSDYNTNSYVPFTEEFLRELGVSDFLSEFGFCVDICGLYQGLRLLDCDDLLVGHRLKVMRAEFHDDCSEEFWLRVDGNLELVFGRDEDMGWKNFELVRARLVLENSGIERVTVDLGVAASGWAKGLETQIDLQSPENSG